MEQFPAPSGNPGGLRARLARLSPEGLRWTVGFFCAFVGAFVLVAPHHFMGRPYVSLRPYAAVWGTLSLLAGVFLLAVSILKPRRWVVVAVHAMVGVALLALAASFGSSGAWTGMISYIVLGLGAVAAGFLRGVRSVERFGDLFALLMGVIATTAGSLMAGAPDLMRSSFSEFSWGYVPTLGVLFLLSGPLLVWVQLRQPGLPRRQIWGGHLLAGLAFFSFGCLASLPLRAWTGVALYLGGGLALAFQPWLRRRLGTVDTSALHIRLALTLATATSLALILATAVVTTQEERLAERQVGVTQQIEADAIAQNVSDYVSLNGSRAFAVAALAGQTSMTPEAQLRLLEASQRAYRDVAGFRTLDAQGRVVAGTGSVGLPIRRLRGIAAEMQAQSRILLDLETLGERPLLLLSAPIRERPGKVSGALVAVFDSESLGRRISRTGSSVHLADGNGFLIAYRDTSEGALPKLPPGWDEQVRAGRRITRQRGLIATAVVPGLGWVVAVERPRAAALAGVRQGRDSAFLLLLLVIPLAVLGGIYAARRIARPLGTLASAVGQIGMGNLGVPVVASGITEVSHLSTAFREMRDRLAARTRESERLAAELRARAEALAETDRRKDEFLAMLAHELRNPLGAISNASYLMEQIGPTEPQMARSVAIIRRQVLHLVRMVDDLLDVSRITRGKVELRKEPVDLVEVVRHAVEMTRPLIEDRGHELRVALPAEPLPLDADVTRLEQVLANLLRNAAKYTDSGGRIELAALRAGEEAVVCVKDTGIGIPPDLLPRVFDLFAQGEQPLDRSGGGLGIGLTLVRSLVEMHGGRVEARSDGPGLGSEFVVRLPLAAQYLPTKPTEKLRPRASEATSSAESR
jgi:signal transduction histidine kinase